MRQRLVAPNLTRRRAPWVLLAAAVAAAAASSALGAPSSGWRESGAVASCTQAAAVEAGRQYAFDPSKPKVSLALCGAFLGPGSEAMVVTFVFPTCWPIQKWAVFALRRGTWQLAKMIPAYLHPPLVAVGNTIRETTAVHRRGDPRCLPSGGKRSRTWSWNGSALAAGPWQQVEKGEPEPRAFYSPSRNIFCGISDDSRSRAAECQSRVPPQKAIVYADGRVTVCRNRTAANRCNLGNPGEGTPTLAYGRQLTVGRFRCESMQIGVRCTVIRSGRGFLINRDGVTRIS
jgi:hypothetical protein